MYEIVPFFIFSILTLGLFSVSVFTKNALYAMSSLAGGMIFISGFFFLLDAEFLGIIQIFVYTGAIMALYAFGMMFFDFNDNVKENIKSKKIIYSLWIVSCVLIVFIVIAPMPILSLNQTLPIDKNISNVNLVGLSIFTKYLIAFEIAALLLLVAMICGIVLASKKMDKKEDIS